MDPEYFKDYLLYSYINHVFSNMLIDSFNETSNFYSLIGSAVLNHFLKISRPYHLSAFSISFFILQSDIKKNRRSNKSKWLI